MTNVPLIDELRRLLNRHRRENISGTPDFVLAQFLLDALVAFETAVARRDSWHGGIDLPPEPPASEPPVLPLPPASEPPLYRPDSSKPYDRRVNVLGGPNKLAEAMERDPIWANQPDMVLFRQEWPQYFDAAFRNRWYRRD